MSTVSSTGTVLGRRLHAELRAARDELERWSVRDGQLVIIDEAGLAGTLVLDAIVAEASAAGGKVLLVGDPFQLSAIEAGGAFAMVVNDRDDPPELTEVRRFRHEWEREASRQLRVGDREAIAAYEKHGRIHAGSRDEMLDALYQAWRTDTERCRRSLMIADDLESVSALNLRARSDRVNAGAVSERCVEIAASGVAGVGDQVVTRENNRRLAAGSSWVKNGDQWIVTALLEDGSLRVRRASNQGDVVLPRAYVQRHVELGYAATAFRAQGRTVDTAHALVDERTKREVLYVAATRGREANYVYVDTTGDEHIDAVTPGDVLDSAIGNASPPTAAREFARRAERAEREPVAPHFDTGRISTSDFAPTRHTF